jgi:hypothetical protein
MDTKDEAHIHAEGATKRKRKRRRIGANPVLQPPEWESNVAPKLNLANTKIPLY